MTSFLITTSLLLLCLVSSAFASKASLHQYDHYLKKYKLPWQQHLKMARLNLTVRNIQFLHDRCGSIIQEALVNELLVPLPLVDSYNFVTQKLIERNFSVAILTDIMTTNSVSSMALIKQARNLEQILYEAKQVNLEKVKTFFMNPKLITLNPNHGISMAEIIAHNARLLKYKEDELELYLKSLNQENTYFINEFQIMKQQKFDFEDVERLNMELRSFKFVLNSFKALLLETLRKRYKFPMYLGDKFNDLRVQLLFTGAKVILGRRLKGQITSTVSRRELKKLNSKLKQMYVCYEIDFDDHDPLFGGIMFPTMYEGNFVDRTELYLYNAFVSFYHIKHYFRPALQKYFNDNNKFLTTLSAHEKQLSKTQDEKISLFMQYMKAETAQLTLRLVEEINEAAKELLVLGHYKFFSGYVPENVLHLGELNYEHQRLKQLNPDAIRGLKTRKNPYDTANRNLSRYYDRGIPASLLEDYYAYHQNKNRHEEVEHLPEYNGDQRQLPEYESLPPKYDSNQ